jgi:DNA-binding CsgD family transcriptional regulator
VAIVMERTTSPQATAVRLEAHGVTAREREIAGLLAAGLSEGKYPLVAMRRPPAG